MFELSAEVKLPVYYTIRSLSWCCMYVCVCIRSMLNMACCVSYVMMYCYSMSEKSVFSSTKAELSVKYGKY
jgi:hypothetical protein